MRCSPGPVQMWCLLACRSSERTLSVSSVLWFLFCVEATSGSSLSLAEVHNFEGMGRRRKGAGRDCDSLDLSDGRGKQASDGAGWLSSQCLALQLQM